MPARVEVLTGETEDGRRALAAVMQRSYHADIDAVPPRWARVRRVDGVPVSFVVVAPDRQMQFPCGDLPYAFVEDAATRDDRRREGHFRAILEDTFAALHATGFSFVVTHGRYQLYRRFGFAVFTHHVGLWVTPEQIEAGLGSLGQGSGGGWLAVDESPYIHPDLLLVTDVRADTLPQCREALREAAALARERGKARILFEVPRAPSYGQRYPLYPSPETPLAALVRACGGEVRLAGADPDGRTVPDADWIKVLDAAGLVSQVTQRFPSGGPYPSGSAAFVTDAGVLTITRLGGRVTVRPEIATGSPAIRWPSSALAQLVTGYQSAEVLAAIHGTPLPPGCAALLDALFPRCWRFSRNESWTYRQ